MLKLLRIDKEERKVNLTQEQIDKIKSAIDTIPYMDFLIRLVAFGDIKALLEMAETLLNISEKSDGYHTFSELYDQRAGLFAALCNAYPDKAWKSKLHADGTMFDGGYFIVGIETPQGQYTYHYKLDRWDLYDVAEIPNAPEWDGHTDKDVMRLLSLAAYRNHAETEATT